MATRPYEPTEGSKTLREFLAPITHTGVIIGNGEPVFLAEVLVFPGERANCALPRNGFSLIDLLRRSIDGHDLDVDPCLNKTTDCILVFQCYHRSTSNQNDPGLPAGMAHHAHLHDIRLLVQCGMR